MLGWVLQLVEVIANILGWALAVAIGVAVAHVEWATWRRRGCSSLFC